MSDCPSTLAQEWSALLDRIQVSRVPYEIREVPLCGERQLFVLVARLVKTMSAHHPAQAFSRIPQEGLDRRRLSRVLDYIQAPLESDLTVDQLAAVACLSRFHFARAFKAATGQSPHRYVSAKRLERAKALLVRGDRSLIDISLTLCFLPAISHGHFVGRPVGHL